MKGRSDDESEVKKINLQQTISTSIVRTKRFQNQHTLYSFAHHL
jgi:hypothetical protein